MDGETKERRDNKYAFKSREKLVSFFSQWLEVPVINSIIENTKHEFIERRDTSQDERRFQYLRKCQFALMARMESDIRIPRL